MFLQRHISSEVEELLSWKFKKYTQVMLRKSVYTRDVKEKKACTVSAPWYSKYQEYLPWYFHVVLSPVMDDLIPYKKTIGWSMVLTHGIEKY